MNTRLGSVSAVALGALLLRTPPTRAESTPPNVTAEATTKASLVWILGDDDAFHAPGDVSPPSPAPSIGDRPGYDALFEGSSSRYTGRENRLEIRLAGVAPGFHPALTTRAELALGIDASDLGARPPVLRFEDTGSFIELFGHFGPRPSDGAGFRLYPLNGDRERLGALEALGVGGAVGPHEQSPYQHAHSAVRAARAWLELAGVRGYVVLKTAGFLEPALNAPAVEETNYAVFGGVESHWRRLVSFGFGFGHFEHGSLPLSGDNIERATTTAGSARLSLGRGLTAPRAPASFGNEPPPFEPTRSDADVRTGWALGVEGAHLVQRLAVFENPGETALAGSRAFAALGTWCSAWLELRLALFARDAGFVRRNAPDLFPGQTLPAGAEELAEWSALASARLELVRPLAFTLALGLRRPAAVLTTAYDRLGGLTGATIVLDDSAASELLPAGHVPVPVVDLRPQVELRVSGLLELLGWVSYRRDFNRARLVADGSGGFERGFADPDRFGYGLAARAMW